MTHKENITAILECYFTGFKEEIIDSACSRILEQERCEATISKQVMLNIVDKMDKALDTDMTAESYKELLTECYRELLTECYKDLPPAIPEEKTEKTGHWIVDIKDMDYCFCSKCNHRFDVDHLKFSWDKYVFPPHCPNCGAKMPEVSK